MKSFLMCGAAALSIACAPSVAAQTAPDAPAAESDATTPGDIVVTAQKRSERLQDVPVAVTVVSGEALAAQGKLNLEGAQYLVPTLTFAKSGTTLNQSLFLRGVGTATFSIAGEPSVSTVVDGVVFSRSGEAFGDLVDIERLEVLRGPQGTLFGKNASAGVINIVSKQPGKVFGGYAEAGYFSRAEYRGRVALDVPLGENVRSRVTGFYTNYDGNIRNLAHGGERVNGFEHYGGRVQVVADASPGLTLTLIADYHRNNDDCCADIIATGPLTALGAASTNLAFGVLPTPRGSDTREVSQNLITATKETGYGLSGQIDLDIAGHTLTSITAYRNYKNTEIRDGDWLPQAYVGFNQLHDFGPQTGNTFSQEVRMTSPGRQFIDYVIGVYYSRAESERVFTRNVVSCTAVVAPTVLTPCGAAGTNPSVTNSGSADFGSVFKNVAVFGQGTINVSDTVRLIAGLRYTHDDLAVFHSRVSTSAVAVGGINPAFGPFASSTSNTNLSGKAGVQFDLSRSSTLYATYARGYKGPAYNVFFNLGATGTNALLPETSDAYEAGIKNTLLDGQLVINLAAFYAKYNNFQANNPDLVAGVVVTRFTNAGEVSTRGGEMDLIYRPIRDFSISGGIAYTDAHVDNFFAAPGAAATAIVPPGTPLAFAPKWKGSLGLDYRARTGGGIDFLGGVQGSYQSKQLSLFAPDATQRLLGTIEGYGLVNLSAGIVDANDKWRITAQVRNLFDQSFAAAIVNGGPGGSYRYQIPRDADRYYGVTGRVNF